MLSLCTWGALGAGWLYAPLSRHIYKSRVIPLLLRPHSTKEQSLTFADSRAIPREHRFPLSMVITYIFFVAQCSTRTHPAVADFSKEINKYMCHRSTHSTTFMSFQLDMRIHGAAINNFFFSSLMEGPMVTHCFFSFF